MSLKLFSLTRPLHIKDLSSNKIMCLRSLLFLLLVFINAPASLLAQGNFEFDKSKTFNEIKNEMGSYFDSLRSVVGLLSRINKPNFRILF